MSLRIAGPRRQVIQAMPSSSRRALIRAEVIMPRSPTMIICCSPNVPRTASTASGKVFGSPVFTGNTGDPKTFPEAVDAVRGSFGLQQMIMVGDRGMITSARIKALRELEGMAWITCLRGPAIRKLMADDGPLQLSLFDEQDLAEISSPDYPGERLIACRNPVLAAERARKREDLLAATERLLRPLIDRVAAGRLRGADAIGLAAGKVIGKHKMAKHLAV